MEECQKYGKIIELKIPRPSGGSRQSTGVGKIFIKYDTAESAKKALQALAGRKFADRTVVTTYFDEVRSTCAKFVPPLNQPIANCYDRQVSMSVLGKAVATVCIHVPSHLTWFDLVNNLISTWSGVFFWKIGQLCLGGIISSQTDLRSP